MYSHSIIVSNYLSACFLTYLHYYLHPVYLLPPTYQHTSFFLPVYLPIYLDLTTCLSAFLLHNYINNSFLSNYVRTIMSIFVSASPSAYLPVCSHSWSSLKLTPRQSFVHLFENPLLRPNISLARFTLTFVLTKRHSSKNQLFFSIVAAVPSSKSQRREITPSSHPVLRLLKGNKLPK